MAIEETSRNSSNNKGKGQGLFLFCLLARSTVKAASQHCILSAAQLDEVGNAVVAGTQQTVKELLGDSLYSSALWMCFDIPIYVEECMTAAIAFDWLMF